MSGSTVTGAASAPAIVAPAAGAPATAKPAVPPMPGLLRRMINGLEYWVHPDTKKAHSPVAASQTAKVAPAPAAASTVTAAAAHAVVETPPAPGLVRRMIDGVEYWYDEETAKKHSVVAKPAATTVSGAAAAPATVSGSAAAPATVSGSAA